VAPEERDLAYLWDMLEYARRVVEIIAGQSKHERRSTIRTQNRGKKRWYQNRSPSRRRSNCSLLTLLPWSPAQ
jgi:hypothetical protein